METRKEKKDIVCRHSRRLGVTMGCQEGTMVWQGALTNIHLSAPSFCDMVIEEGLGAEGGKWVALTTTR